MAAVQEQVSGEIGAGSLTRYQKAPKGLNTKDPSLEFAVEFADLTMCG